MITSRATVFDSFGLVTPLALGVLSPEEALTFLLTRTGRPHPDQAEHHAAELLAEALGYLPLALEQSSAYILAKHAPFQTYLTSYRSQRLALLNKSRPKLGEYPAAVATTWTLNIREVEHTPGALDLLRLSSFLSPDQIPLELIGQGATHLGNSLSEVLASVEEDPLVLHELLEPLARYSLIQADVDTQTYSIHRLVQEVVKDNMDAATQRFWAERTVRVVNTSFPFDEAGPWALSQRYLPHALLCQALIVQEQMLFPEAANLLYKVGIYFYWRAQYPEVEPLFPQALGIQEHLFGPEHPNTANSLDSLASLYHKQGQDEQAEPLYQQALAIYERVLGTEHPSAVRTLENYIVLLEKTKRQAEAAKLKERVKAIRAKKQR